MSRNSPNRNIFQKLIKLNKTNEDEWFYESESLKYGGVIIFIDDLKLFKLLAFLYFHVEIN